MSKITRKQKEELLRLLEEDNIVEVLRRLEEIGAKEHFVSRLRNEFVNGGKFSTNYREKLKVFILSLEDSYTESINVVFDTKLLNSKFLFTLLIGVVVVVGLATQLNPISYFIGEKDAPIIIDTTKTVYSNIDSLYRIIEIQQETIKEQGKSIQQISPLWGKITYVYFGIFLLVVIAIVIWYFVFYRKNKVGNQQVISHTEITINENQRKEIIEETKKNVIDKLTEDIKEDIAKNERYKVIYENLNYSKSRLENEISSLNKKANRHLWIAVFITSLVVIFLVVNTLLNKNEFDNVANFLYFFIPRLSLMVFIELFSFYFLSLYRTNSNEIKYYQNELTDLEYKSMSLKMALLGNNEAKVDYLIDEILKTERNKVIKKDETTVELEMHKFNHDSVKNYLFNGNAISEYFKKAAEKKEEEKKEEKKDDKDKK